MKHIMIDAYNCNSENLDSLKDIYESITYLINRLGLKAIMPPSLVPYHFCKNHDDSGISAFVLLEGGHFSIHTFPVYGCYFADLMYDEAFSKEEVYRALNIWFPCAKDSFYVRVADRDEISQEDCFSYSGEADFGPHFMYRAKLAEQPSLDWMINRLDNMPEAAGMHPITRPCVLPSSISNPKYLSGIVLIAESHIAIHYCVETKTLYMDVFSCKGVDEEKFPSAIATILPSEYEGCLTRRGRRNNYRKLTSEERFLHHKDWQEVISNKNKG